MSKIKLNDLKKTAKEFNDLLFDENVKKDGWIEVTSEKEKLENDIWKASNLLTDDEYETISDVAYDVVEALIKELGNPPQVTEAEDTISSESHEDQEIPLLELIETSTDLEILKEMIRTKPEFKKLKKEVGIIKNLETLKTKMLECLGIIVETTTVRGGNQKPPKKIKASSFVNVKPKEHIYNRVDAVSEALKQNPKTIEDWANKAGDFMEKNEKSRNVSENISIIRYFLKMNKHFEFGHEMPLK